MIPFYFDNHVWIIGGTGNEPFFFTLDIHYQSTGIGTKSKDPDYYT